MHRFPITFRWIPGTLDRILVHGPLDCRDVTVAQVHRALGREALDALYLRGRFIVDGNNAEDAHRTVLLLSGDLEPALAAD